MRIGVKQTCAVVIGALILVLIAALVCLDDGDDDGSDRPLVNEDYLSSGSFDIKDEHTGSWIHGTLFFYDMGDHLDATAIVRFRIESGDPAAILYTNTMAFSVPFMDVAYPEDYEGNRVQCDNIAHELVGTRIYIYGYGEGTAIIELQSTRLLERGADQVTFRAGAGDEFHDFTFDLPEWGS